MSRTRDALGKLKRLERPVAKYLVAFVVAALVVSAGVYAVTVPDSAESDFFMRGDQQTVNGFTAYRLGETQSGSSQQVTITESEAWGADPSDGYWGIRVYRLSESGQLSEITQGSPVAVVSRSGDNVPSEGVQSETWTPPETELAQDDTVVVRVYQSLGPGNWQEAASFSTQRLNASELNPQTWTINYYTRLYNPGSVWDAENTGATFYWGQGYGSGIDGFNYSLARLEASQQSPTVEEETWPGQSFTHSVQLSCRASSCENVTVTPKACEGPLCTNFRKVSQVPGLSYGRENYSADLLRDQAPLVEFDVTAEQEGDYRLRFDVESDNVPAEDTSTGIVDVSVAEVNVSSVQHENTVEHDVSQYEAGDSMEFLNITLSSTDPYGYWISGTSNPSVVRTENGSSRDLSSLPAFPEYKIVSGALEGNDFYLGGGNGELTKYNGSFTDISEVLGTSDTVTTLSGASDQLVIGTGNPGLYVYDIEQNSRGNISVFGGLQTPRSSANSYGAGINGDYFLVGTSNPALYRVWGGVGVDVTPSFVDSAITAIDRNSTTFIFGDSSGNVGLYNGASSTDITSEVGMGGNAVRAAKWGGFKEENVTNFWLIGGGSGTLRKYYPNGTSVDLTGQLPGSWTVESIQYSEEQQKFLIGGGSGNLYSYTSSGFTDLTPTAFETGDGTVNTIIYAESEGGKAFNVQMTPRILSPNGNQASWGPSGTRSCGDLPKDSGCEKTFGDFQIPQDAQPGLYNFSVSYDWSNFGPGLNTSSAFELVNVRETINSSLDERPLFKGSSTSYNVSIRNEWSEPLQNLDISVNCPSALTCSQEVPEGNTLAAGTESEASFSVSASNSVSTGLYTVNATVSYDNPDESKQYTQVEPITFKVADASLLVATVESDVPGSIVRGNSFDVNGSLKNNDDEATGVSLNYTLPSGWSANSPGKYLGTVSGGEKAWNNITADVGIATEKGENTFYINSSADTEERNDFDRETVTVYSDTSLSLTLNNSAAVQGSSIEASVTLEEDTGKLLSNQEILFRDTVSGETISTETTGPQGEASVQFKIPEDWEAGEHNVKAVYESNETLYTDEAAANRSLRVYDRPDVSDVQAVPSPAGVGVPVEISATVTDGDNLSTVEALVTGPSGSSYTLSMSNSSSQPKDFSAEFSSTWEEGEYSYEVRAEDQQGFTTVSQTEAFRVESKASINVVTENDTYGPYTEVLLERGKDVKSNRSESLGVLTDEKYIYDIFASGFNVDTGSATDVSNTQSLDSTYFTMTQNDGSWLEGANSFTGTYSYTTDLEEVQQITMQSYGSVSAGTWNLEVRNYNTESWEALTTVSNTADAWTNSSICSTGCGNYISDGQVQIRVTSSNPTEWEPVWSYDVDFQELAFTTDSGEVSKSQPGSSAQVGKNGKNRSRYSSSFSFSQMPYRESAEITSANLYVPVESGTGTMAVYNVQNFQQSNSSEQIHRNTAPAEATQANPITTVGTSPGLKQIDVTQAVNTSYEAGRKEFAFQIREEGEDQWFQIGRPLYLVVNYTAESEIVNTGSNNLSGTVQMIVERKTSSGWDPAESIPLTQEVSIEAGESLNLSSIWRNGDGFNTAMNPAGKYRVVAELTDGSGEIVDTGGEPIRDTYGFRIGQSELALTEILHENTQTSSINEYGVGDTIDWINLTISNSEFEAANASAVLRVLGKGDQTVTWGPDSRKIFGDIPVGSSETRRWDNSGTGYEIPLEASSGTFTFNWETVLDAANAEREVNRSLTFQIHDIPGNFNSQIIDGDNRILRNDSTFYNFTVNNLWSESLQNVNITVNCNASLSCDQRGGTGQKIEIGSINAGDSYEASFNVSTDENTPTANYDINATVEYVNPGGERKIWTEYNNRILSVRIPGSFLNITDTPEEVLRGGAGYNFKALVNNTYSTTLTNHSSTWTIPDTWDSIAGGLKETEENHQPNEIFWNNFTAEVGNDSALGPTRINLSTDNDQERVDSDFVFVDVYAPTDLALDINNTEPAEGKTVEIQALLQYNNGTGIPDQPLHFADQRTGNDLGTVYTNSTGYATLEYEADQPYGDHRFNVSYTGSETLYTIPESASENITVYDRPNITDLSVSPQSLGFGYSTTINASVTDREGLASVELRVTYPNTTRRSFSMNNPSGDLWERVFSDTWQSGSYDFTVVANDTQGKVAFESSSFQVEVSELSSINTLEEQYSPGEDVNLTEYEDPWWDRNWDFRKRIQVTETSGNNLVNYPVSITLTGLGDNTNSCQDIRVVENNQLRDYVVESCNPYGDTVIRASTNVSASSTDSDLYVYYGNPEASSYDQELYAYRIASSGSYTPDGNNIDRIFSYNGGESIFRYADLSFSGNLDSVTVTGITPGGSTDTIYTATGSGDPAPFTYYDNPQYSQIRVEVQGNPYYNPEGTSMTYDFTTPSQATSSTVDTQDLLPSLIQNTGENSFRGRVLLQVTRNTSGSWTPVTTIYNETSPSQLDPASNIYFGNLWNDNPWNTGAEPAGYYRAVFKLLSPSGKTLSTSQGEIERRDTFKLNAPASDVNVQDIEIYNVTGGSETTSTQDLEASGLNNTFSVPGGNTYRFDVSVKNADSAEANWTIESTDLITYQGLNSSWTVDTSEIFYQVPEGEYTGGSYSSGTIEWDTSSGGELSPGENATFSYVIQVPNNQSLRDVLFEINASSFRETDDSELEVFRVEDEAPNPVVFDLNTTNVTRGETIKGVSRWSEELSTANAELNLSSPTLINNSVTPEGLWANYSFSTGDSLKGPHAFRFYGTDQSGNTGKTVQDYFHVYGKASITDTALNASRITDNETSRFSCRVTSDLGDPVKSYNVSFFDENGMIGSALTNSTGWSSVTYSNDNIGPKDLVCGINDDRSRYLVTGDAQASRTVRVVEEQPPNYTYFNLNTTRIFRSITNDTAEFTSRWEDNQQLNNSALVIGNQEAGELTIPETKVATKSLTGTEDWANYSFSVPENYTLRDTNLSIYAQDTSLNVNGTPRQRFEVWAWGILYGEFVGGADDNRVQTGVEATYQCGVVLDNNEGVPNYPITFYDNETGSWQEIGTNQTVETESGSTVASFSKSYSSTGTYRWKCNISESESRNIAPYPPENNKEATLTVDTGDIEPPVIINDNYGLNATQAFRGQDSVKLFAQWNETIESAEAEYSVNGSYRREAMPEPYTDDWTNYTLDVKDNWSVGPHEIKAYATDVPGNTNTTLDYLQYDIFGRSEVNWLSPTGTAEKGMNTLECGVNSVETGEPIENYPVNFFVETNLEGSNQTGPDGTATFQYNSSSDSTGEKTWSCGIGDEPGLYYTASANNSDAEQIELVEELASTVSGNITNPVDGTTLAQNKTFTANVTIKCSDGDCGEVNASLRYNSSGLEPDTEVPEASGKPFHTIGSNSKACNLNRAENCTVSFEVNASGQQNQAYNLDAVLSSPNAQLNDTENVDVNIDVVLLTDFEYSEINFASTPPNQTVAAPGNTAGSYSFSLSENSNDAEGVWIRMTNLSQVDGSYEIRPQYTKWSLKPPCSQSGSYNMTRTYSEVVNTLSAGETLTQCYWQRIPFAKRSGNYIGTMSIKVNTTE